MGDQISFYCQPFTMGSPWIDLGMKMLEKVDWEDVKETAKFYYTDSNTTLNLYPALFISILLLFLLVPLLGAIPTIDLFPSTGGGYGYGQTSPSSGYGAPEPSYGAPSDGYGAPARNSWAQGGEYRSFQDEDADNLKDIYNNDWSSSNTNFANAEPNVARSIEASPLTNLVNNAIKLIN